MKTDVGKLTITSFLLMALTLLTMRPVAADTFTVTSTQCEGAGSITEAMEMANNNTGVVDTITFEKGLKVEARTCPFYPQLMSRDDHMQTERTALETS